MTVRFRLVAKLGIAIAIIIVGGFAVLGVHSYSDRLNEVALDEVSHCLLPSSLQAQEALSAFEAMTKLQEDAVLIGEPELLKRAVEKFKTASRILSGRAMTSANHHGQASEMKDLEARMRAYCNRAGKVYPQIVASDTIGDDLSDEVMALARERDHLRNALVALKAERVDRVISELQNVSMLARRRGFLSLLAFLAISTVSGVAAYRVVSYLVVRPLGRLVTATAEVAIGHFDRRVQIHQKDEIGDLATAFNLMAERLGKSLAEKEREIVERRKAEDETRKLNETLEQRVEERTLKLSEANIELREAMERLKVTQGQLIASEKMASLGGLVAGVAHEINTPVGVSLTMASHLDRETHRIQDALSGGSLKRSELLDYFEATAEGCDVLLANLNRSADLISSFKQVAVDQTHEERRSFKVRDYINEVLASLKPKFKKTRHVVDVHCPPDLAIDSYPGALSQILTNLVNNALIHGFNGVEHGEVTIDVARRNGDVHLAFSDNGKGIAQEHQSKVFEPFFTTARERGGTGLGMHIVYNLVTQRLDGEIECHSRPGEGTTFSITMPFYSKETEKEKHHEHATRG